jgi:F-type H+-transporting ATPase subunit beta
MSIGKVVQVVGAVVDVEFPGALPGIYNALSVDYNVKDRPSDDAEVQQHLGDNWVRTIMSARKASNEATRSTPAARSVLSAKGYGPGVRRDRKPGGRARAG